VTENTVIYSHKR